MSITAPYAEIAPTVAALKALTPELRCPNHCLFVPPLGSWVYYSATSTAAANDTTIFEPNDGLGRWILAQPTTAPSGGSSGGSGITQQPGIEPAQATLTDIQRTVNQILSTLTAAGVTGAIVYTRNYDAANPTNDLINLIGTNGGTVAYSNPFPSKLGITANNYTHGQIQANLFNRATGDFYFGNQGSGSWLLIDFGSGRTIIPTGIGWQATGGAGAYSPNNLIIQGSNDGVNFTNLSTWITGGFSGGQWKYHTFSNTTAYRYLRLQTTVQDTAGTWYIGGAEVNIYGTLSSL